jgi:hypothetical protein
MHSPNGFTLEFVAFGNIGNPIWVGFLAFTQQFVLFGNIDN